MDPNDDLWVLDITAGYLGLTKIRNDGAVLSPSGGYPVSTGGIANPSSGESLTSDAFGDIWIAVIRTSDSAACVTEYSSSGSLLSPATGYCGSQAIASYPTQVVADSSGNVYLYFGVSSSSAIEQFSPTGNYVDFPFPPDPVGGIGLGVSGFYAGVFDPKLRHLCASGENTIKLLTLNGTYIASVFYFTSYFVPDGGRGLAVDGGGNLWLANSQGILAEIGPSGNAACLTSGSALCGIQVLPTVPKASGTMAGIAIDPSGAIFTVDVANGALLKLIGLATAK